MLSTEKRNLKRILLLFIYPFIFLLKVIPRNKKIWVFGNFKGYLDNTKYLYEFVEEKDELKVYWITRDEKLYKLLKSKNKRVLYYGSLKAVWISLRAGVSFQSNGYSDLNKIAALNSFNINLWHGFPIKKIIFDAELEVKFSSFGLMNSALTFLSSKALMFLNNKIDLFVVSSNIELKRMANAFKVSKDKFRIVGTPRFDIINKEIDSIPSIAAIFEKHNITKGKNIMYAPTWRENGWNSKQIINNTKRFNSFLETNNSYFYIKKHPLTTKKEIENWGIKENKRIIFTSDFDINESYKFIDILITDFSSLIFDYGILNKPILYFITDLKDYSDNRGFYDDVTKISGNKINQTWDDLITSLEANIKQDRYIDHLHFDYLMQNPPNNVRENIIKMVNKEIKNG